MKLLENEHQKKAVLLTFLYAVAISFLRSYHEVWKDEGERFVMAIESPTIIDFFRNFHTTGHPTLWPLLLRLGWIAIKSPFLLDITAVAVSTAGIYIFLSRSPFTWPQKILFILGYFPIYEYSVFSPHYGLSMTLLFLFCALYEKRSERPVAVACALALLANTNAHSLIIAVAFGLPWIAELGLAFVKKKQQVSVISFTAAGAIFFLSIFLSILQILPPKTVYLTGVYTRTGADFLKAALHFSYSPGDLFRGAFGFHRSYFVTGVIMAVFFLLLGQKRRLVSFSCFLSIFGISLLFQLVYPGAIRHQGFLYLIIIASFWMAGPYQAPKGQGEIYARILSLIRTALIYGLLILQVHKACPAVYNEITKQTSSSKKLGEYLKAHPEFKDAIIIPERDTYIHSIAYYVKNKCYLPREKKFERFVLYAEDYKKNLYLSEFLKAAEEIRNDYKSPILLIISDDLIPGKFFLKKRVYGRSFRYDPLEVSEFNNKTKKISSFRQSIRDENYDLYLLK